MRTTGLFVLLLIAGTATAEVRQSAVAGTFYPGSERELRVQVRTLLDETVEIEPSAAVIVPHAGYVFSGETAASAFRSLQGRGIRRVVLLGPSHHERFRGGALPEASCTAFRTPLGEMELDRPALRLLRDEWLFDGPTKAHDREHSLEVEVPFLQMVAPGARLIPVLVGHQTRPEDFAVMARTLAGLLDAETVVVASSDFTHHGRGYGWSPFEGDDDLPTRLLDLARATIGRATALDPRGFWDQVSISGDTVCGARPIAILLHLLGSAFEGHGEMRHLTTSGHVSGQWDRVVTYAAVTFDGKWRPWRDAQVAGPLSELDDSTRRRVLTLARATLESHLGHGPELANWYAAGEPGPELMAMAGAFVTLNNTGEAALSKGRLRACMGVIEAKQPVVDAVVHAAATAAHDSRFPRLTVEELAELEIEVSLLTAPRRVPGPEAIRLGTHGVVLSREGKRAVYLPQVATETGWDRETFLRHLALKAGMPIKTWQRGARFEVFTAQVFAEHH